MNLIKDDNYTLKVSTELTPFNFEYATSETAISYYTPSENNITTLEFIKGDDPTTLSNQYKILGKEAKILGNYYKHSKDDTLKIIFNRYIDIYHETKLLSILLKIYLSDYDLTIQKSSAVISDALDPGDGGGVGGNDLTCFWCEIAVGVGTILLCIAVIWWFPPAAAFCIEALDIFHITGSTYITCQIMTFCP